MKLEIRKVTNPDGGIFYQVFQDNRIMNSFWIENYLTGEKAWYGDGSNPNAAFDKAKEYYELIKANHQSDPIVEIIQSEDI